MFENIIDDECVMIDFVKNYKEVTVAIKNQISSTIYRTNQKINLIREEKLSVEIGTFNGQITIPAGRICRKQATLTLDGNSAELTNNGTDIQILMMRGQQIDVKNLQKIEELYVEVDLINEEVNLYNDFKKTQLKASVQMNSYSGTLKIDGQTYGKFVEVADQWEYIHLVGKTTAKLLRGQKMNLCNKQRVILNGEKMSIEFQ